MWAYGLVYPVLLHKVEWVGHDRKIDEEHDKDCVEQEFQLVRAKLPRDGEETVKI